MIRKRLSKSVRGEAPADDPLGDKRVTFSSPEIVSASLPDRWPQEGQNRASCGMSAAQSTHRTMEFYAKQAWQLIREA